MSKKITENILNVFRSNNSFLILLHMKPDGDAIGSGIALGKGLKKLNKAVDYYIETPIERKLNFFNEIANFNNALKTSYDVIVFLDCSSFDFSFHPEKLPEYKTKLVIDHHKSNLKYGDLNYVEITGATAEIVFRILMELEINLDGEMADAIFTGISTDTGSFQFSNVTSDTHEILSELYKIKRNYAPLSKKLHSEKTLDQFKIMGEAIKALEIIEPFPIAMMVLDFETLMKYGGVNNIPDDVANIGQNIIDNTMTVLMKEVAPGEYRVSLRSKPPFDIQELAVRHGGGGHERAAGFTYTGNINDLKLEIVEVYKKQLELNNG
ncbi:MAG: DHH family phosphoesterase [Eubacteriaceae bacterium]